MPEIIKKWSQYIVAYTMWIVSFLMWIYFILTSRYAILGLLQLYYVENDFQRKMELQLVDRVYVISTGIIWLILMIVVENTFRHGIVRGDLARRVGRVLAPEAILILLADAALAFLIGFDILPWSRWLLLVIELAASVSLLWLAINAPGPVRKYKVTNENLY